MIDDLKADAVYARIVEALTDGDKKVLMKSSDNGNQIKVMSTN